MKYSWRVLFICILALMMLAACTMHELQEPLQDRESKEKVLALREQYPYSNELSPMADLPFGEETTWDYYLGINNFESVAVVEITDELFVETIYLYPFADEKANEAVGTMRVDGRFIPAKITQIITGDTSLKKGSKVNLFFGSNDAAPIETLKAYKIGQKYICFLTNLDLQFDVEECYCTKKYQSLYLTEENVVLAMTDIVSCLDDCSGMYLDTFAETVKEQFTQSYIKKS